MVEKFVCSNPDRPEERHSRYYNEITLDGFCPDCPLGAGILIDNRPEPPRTIGLLILVCETSYAMTEKAFSGMGSLSPKKVDLLTRSLARDIADRYRIIRSEDAYIALIGFGAEAKLLRAPDGRPFLKSGSEIRDELPTPAAITAYLAAALNPAGYGDRSYRDVTKALTLARHIHEGALAGNLGEFGLWEDVWVQSDEIYTAGGRTLILPKLRTLLFSGGEHRARDGDSVRNPYRADEVSTLVTIFIGTADSDNASRLGVARQQDGGAQMKAMARACPTHDRLQFFLLDRPTDTFRGFFGLNGTDGFCPVCLPVWRRV